MICRRHRSWGRRRRRQKHYLLSQPKLEIFFICKIRIIRRVRERGGWNMTTPCWLWTEQFRMPTKTSNQIYLSESILPARLYIHSIMWSLVQLYMFVLWNSQCVFHQPHMETVQNSMIQLRNPFGTMDRTNVKILHRIVWRETLYLQELDAG